MNESLIFSISPKHLPGFRLPAVILLSLTLTPIGCQTQAEIRARAKRVDAYSREVTAWFDQALTLDLNRVDRADLMSIRYHALANSHTAALLYCSRFPPRHKIEKKLDDCHTLMVATRQDCMRRKLGTLPEIPDPYWSREDN